MGGRVGFLRIADTLHNFKTSQTSIFDEISIDLRARSSIGTFDKQSYSFVSKTNKQTLLAGVAEKLVTVVNKNEKLSYIFW